MGMIRPLYKRLLIAVIVVYVIGVCMMLSDIYVKLGKIEHTLSHAGGGHKH